MGAAVDVCTWKPCGQASKFVVGAGVAGACFGHMVAAVWDGSAVRRQNKDRLKRCLDLSVAEHGNGAGAPPQHAWAASLLRNKQSTQPFSHSQRLRATIQTCHLSRWHVTSEMRETQAGCDKQSRRPGPGAPGNSCRHNRMRACAYYMNRYRATIS